MKSHSYESSLSYFLDYLQDKYRKTALTTSEVGTELSISQRTIVERVRQNKNLPNYKRTSKGKGGRILFPIYEVAKYLATDLHEVE